MITIAVLCALAQDPVTIAGSVVDAGTGQPIADASITAVEVLVKAGIVQYAGANSAPVATTKTNIGGSFRIAVPHPGRYRISINTDDYVTFSRVVEVPTGESATSFEARLEHYGTLIGRLFDGKLQKAVAGLEVTPFRIAYYRGRRALQYWPGSNTDASGNFRISGLRPGDYLLEIRPPVREAILILKGEESSESDGTREKVYRRVFYPEGSLTHATPIKLYSGAEVNLGDVPITKEPLYQIRGTLRAGNCEESDTINVSMFDHFGTMKRSGPGATKLACGSRFVAAKLAPGNYSLRAWVPGRAFTDRPTAFSEIEIHDRDVEIDLTLTMPTIVRGRLRFRNHFFAGASSPENIHKETLKSLRIGIQGTEGPGFVDEMQQTPPSSDGAFVMPVAPAGDLQLTLAGLQPPHYIKEVLYNGTRLAGMVFRLNREALDQSLTIVLANDSATIQGTVEDTGNQAVAEASVLLLSSPLRYENGFPVFTSAVTDGSGRFVFKGVAPGSYRVLSFPSVGIEQIQETDVLATLANRGIPMEVKPHESRSIVVQSLR